MQAVCELRSFTRAADEAGMTAGEIDGLMDFVARNPLAGEELVGTGGCRKLRLAGKGKGKSGGYRVVTFFSGESVPVFLITVFAKGDRANLSKSERNQLGELSKKLVREYGNKVLKVRADA